MDQYRKLLAALILYQHNTHILHWNVKGVDFDPTHSMLDEYYDHLGALVDEVAETGIQLDIPPVSLSEAVSILEGDSGDFMEVQGTETFTSLEAFKKIDFMFEGLIKLYETVYADPKIPADIVNKLQEHTYWLRKQRQYKTKRRLQ